VWGFAALGAISGIADDILPPRFNFDRYARMADHAPFAVATAVALPEATPDFAKDLYVANAAHSSDGDMATIMSSSDQNFKKYLTTREPVDGYGIASIEWSEKVGETKVTINKDGKFATLTFNQALLSQAASATGQMPQSVPLIPSPQAGARQSSRAHARGVIQRNPKAIAAAASTPNPVPTPTPNLEPPPLPQALTQLPPGYEDMDPMQLAEQQERQATEVGRLLRQKTGLVLPTPGPKEPQLSPVR
jgi:hypothetical protein